jgi:bacillolysin
MVEALEDLRWHVTRSASFEVPPVRSFPGIEDAILGGGFEVAPGETVTGRVTRGWDGSTGDPAFPEGDDYEVATSPAEPGAPIPAFHSDEAAARYYLEQLVLRDKRPAIRQIAAPDRTAVVPDLRLVETQDAPATRTRILRFEQAHQRIPVFGSRAIVELDPDRTAISVSGQFVDASGVPMTASRSPKEALDRLVERHHLDPEQAGSIAAPRLMLFRRHARQRCHLVYLFVEVPGGFHPRTSDHGFSPSPRSVFPKVNVMLDAHDLRTVFEYGATPTVDDLPVNCTGLDEFDTEHEFYGRATDGGVELRDQVNHLETFDLDFADVDNAATPKQPVTSVTSDWGAAARAAVSAHVNGWLVMRFFDAVLQRDGIDGKNMPLVSVVNCLFRPEDAASRSWKGAFWMTDRMVYGQTTDNTAKRLVSYSRFLDVIAHELTHGITDNTSKLVYQGESGALNESISDIFGILVKNWDWSTESGGSVAKWSWEIGSGLGANGLPLRDLSDPTRTGDPDHMSKFRKIDRDNGGVHTNSNIHNKAAYMVLTAPRPDGRPLFSPRQVAALYYYALRRLTSLATFHDALLELVDVTASMNPIDTVLRDQRLDGLKAAYASVGIS